MRSQLSVIQTLLLKKVKSEIRQKSGLALLQESARKLLSAQSGITLEYFEIRNAETLQYTKRKSEKMVALVAAKIGGVRLIDNLLLN